jgi:hypothetical protein
MQGRVEIVRNRTCCNKTRDSDRKRVVHPWLTQ